MTKKERKQLKPGMYVRSLVSGNLAELVRDPRNPTKLWPCLEEYVLIKRKSPSGKWQYTHWALKFIEVV